MRSKIALITVGTIVFLLLAAATYYADLSGGGYPRWDYGNRPFILVAAALLLSIAYVITAYFWKQKPPRRTSPLPTKTTWVHKVLMAVVVVIYVSPFIFFFMVGIIAYIAFG